MFAQFFVLNLRGEAIIFRDCANDAPRRPLAPLSECPTAAAGPDRGTASKQTSEVFFREVIAKKPPPPPCFVR
jgi:hypothetical protein